MNLVQGVFSRNGDDLTLTLGDQSIPVPGKLLEERPALRGYLDRPVAVGIRPEDMEDASISSNKSAILQSTADLVEALGSDLLVHFSLNVPQVVTEDTRELAADIGADEVPSGSTSRGTDLVARFNPRSRVREGDTISVAVDTERIHVFDAETGVSIWGDSDR